MRLDGLISGMNTREVIHRSMEIERRPIERKEESIKDIDNQIEHWRGINKALKNLADTISPLKDRDLFLSKSATSNNNTISVSVTSKADETTYDIKIKQTASVHRISSLRLDARDKPIAELLEESELLEDGEDFGGRFKISMGDESEEFPVLDENNDEMSTIDESTTLEELRDIINESKIQVRANIIDNRLIIEGTKEGLELELKDLDGGNVLQKLDTIEEDPQNPDEFIINQDRTLQEPKEAILEVNVNPGGPVGLELDRDGYLSLKQDQKEATILKDRLNDRIERMERRLEKKKKDNGMNLTAWK